MPPRAEPAPRVRRRTPLAEQAAPWVLVAWVLIQFEPFRALFQPPEGPTSMAFILFALGVLLLTRSSRLANATVSLPAFALIGWFGVSLLWSENPSFTLFLIRFELIPLLLVALVVATMEPRVVIRTLLATMLAVGAWSLLSSFLLPISRETVTGSGEPQVGFRGTFVHKNWLGVFGVYLLCLLVAFGRGRGRRAVALGALLLVVGTRSATAAAGLLAVGFVWFWMTAIDQQRSRRERQALLITSVGSALAGVLVVLGLAPTLLNLYDKDITFSGRTEIWAASFDAIGRNPLRGYGFGGIWSDLTLPVTVELQRNIGFEAAHGHNSLVDVLLDGGLVALALAVLLLAEAVWLGLWCVRRPSVAPYGRWALLTILTMIIMGLAEPLMKGPSLGLLVIIVTVLTQVRVAERRAERTARRTAMRERALRSGAGPRPSPSPA